MDTTHVHYLNIDSADDGQRIDNFIRKRYPNLPKSRIYQMLRKGEVRLNKKRLKPTCRVHSGDILRLPPIPDGTRQQQWIPPRWQEQIKNCLLYEDDDFLILNKPTGIPVHAGSRQEYGVIDVVRALWGEHYAELAHRLDAETSGCLVLGKNRDALLGFQQLLKQRQLVEKRYWCLVEGVWPMACQEVSLLLTKQEDKVMVTQDGKEARTYFTVQHALKHFTLLEALLDTGRTHQIRVSTAYQGYPIVGDRKYGHYALNRHIAACGFRGMFLHARRIRFPYRDNYIDVEACLPDDAQQLLNYLKETDS